uniref:Putative secreted protein n=1 Tax=Anopheles darlingi TaxID=43151 RepID=A0A2M4D4M0_ANODA
MLCVCVCVCVLIVDAINLITYRRPGAAVVVASSDRRNEIAFHSRKLSRCVECGAIVSRRCVLRLCLL